MSWAKIVSAINSNLSRSLDQQINDRFNQVDTRLNTLESRMTTASNTIIAANATGDRVLERVSEWRAVASDNVRDGQNNIHVALPESDFGVTNNVLRMDFFIPGAYRVKVNFRSTAGPTIHFAGNVRSTISSGNLVAHHVFDITVSNPVTHFLGFQPGLFTILFDCSICYDIVEILPKRLPVLTRVM